MNGDITLAGVTLTLEEWQALDKESQELLMSMAFGAGDEEQPMTAGAVHVAQMVDMLASSLRD